MKKAVMMFVLFILCSSIFAFAQETDDIYDEDIVEECGLGCKIWQFLFGSKDARAGRAWFDRSEALVGEAAVTDEQKATELFKQGKDAMDKNNYASAERLFRQSDTLYPSLNTKVLLGEALQNQDTQDKYKDSLLVLQPVAEAKEVEERYKPSVERAKELVIYSKAKIIYPGLGAEDNYEYRKVGGKWYTKEKGKEDWINIESSKKGDPKVAIERLEKAYGASGASSQSKIDPAAKSQLESTLGASYPGF